MRLRSRYSASRCFLLPHLKFRPAFFPIGSGESGYLFLVLQAPCFLSPFTHMLFPLPRSYSERYLMDCRMLLRAAIMTRSSTIHSNNWAGEKNMLTKKGRLAF